jgi:hypothetical protein
MGEQMQKRKSPWQRVPLTEIRDLLREQGLDVPASASKDANNPVEPTPTKARGTAVGKRWAVAQPSFKRNSLWIDKALLRRLYGRAPRIFMDPAGLERYQLGDLRAANREARMKRGF